MPTSVSENPSAELCACRRCGLILRAPETKGRPACPRCGGAVGAAAARRAVSPAWPAALALAALILYPLAMALPVLEVSRLGHAREATIWSGVVELYADGHAAVATIVLVCSVVAPLGKIIGVLALSLAAGREGKFSRRRQHLTYRAIDWIGRWGMIDVLLVAVLVAAVKLGDWVTVSAGPGVLAFAAVVVLSLLASMTFDPRSIWAGPDS